MNRKKEQNEYVEEMLRRCEGDRRRNMFGEMWGVMEETWKTLLGTHLERLSWRKVLHARGGEALRELWSMSNPCQGRNGYLPVTDTYKKKKKSKA